MSNKFKTYKGLDLTKVADDVLIFWEENNIFQKSINQKDEKNLLFSMKVRHRQMVYQEFIMLWGER